jgi:tripartite-type tricarboxylate transporter receptor subunit TctC
MRALPSKVLMTLLVAAAGAFATSSYAAYPDKPIRLVIGFPPGSATDTATRIIAAKLSSALGQQVVVDNKPGASTNIAGGQVAHSAPDGYTIFMAGNTNAVNPSLMKNIPFDITKDFEPIGMAATVTSILVVHPSLHVGNVPELTKLVKASPGKINFASSGNGTMSHLSGELYALSLNTKMTHIAYKGSSQAVNDLLSGAVPVMFAPASTVIPLIKDGKLIGLATTGSERSSLLPDIPTVAEGGIKNFDVRIWFGLVAPKGTPAAVVKALGDALMKAVDSPDVIDQLAKQGIEPFKGDGAFFSKYMSQEMAKWAAVISSAGITAE